MDAENLVVDHHAQSQEVEHVGEVVPHVGVAVLAGAFGVKAIRLGNAAGLMIASDQVDSVGIPKFQAHQKRDGLDAEQTAIDVIACFASASRSRQSCAAMTPGPLTEKQVVCIRAEAANLEDLDHVKELAMDIPDDGDRSSNVHHIALFHEQFFCFCAYCFHHRFREEFLFVQSFYTFIEINARCGDESARNKASFSSCLLQGSPGIAQGITSLKV